MNTRLVILKITSRLDALNRRLAVLAPLRAKAQTKFDAAQKLMNIYDGEVAIFEKNYTFIEENGFMLLFDIVCDVIEDQTIAEDEAYGDLEDIETELDGIKNTFNDVVDALRP